MAKLGDLLKKRAAYRAVAAEANAAADKVDKEIVAEIERARRFFGGDSPAPKHQVMVTKGKVTIIKSAPPPAPATKKGRTPKLQEPIREIFLNIGNKPLTQDELHKHLDAAGVPINGKRPRHTLSAHISYLIEKGLLVRVENKLALKQAALPNVSGQLTNVRLN